jgi:hypothetical protein
MNLLLWTAFAVLLALANPVVFASHTLSSEQRSTVEKPIPDYHPYVASGDFNGDGAPDCAVIVINTRKPHDFTLLVFNGPVDTPHPIAAFVYAHHDLTRTGLFYGPPRPKPYRLLIGPFESEGLVLQPRGKTYRLEE